MPLRFLFGGRRKKAQSGAFDDGLSEAGSFRMPDEEDEDKPNETFFMNPDFGFMSPTPSAVGSTAGPRLVKRQITKRMSSKIRECRQATAVDCPEYDIDVELIPSAFALQAVPNARRGTSFCSRDDSEVATKTNIDAMSELARPTSGQNTPYVNALFLHNLSFNDDSDVGSCTCGKIPLRHMGSALSYRLSMAETPDYSVYGDEDAMIQSPKRPGHARHHSDASIASVKERNQMVSLESLVQGLDKPHDPVFEFGIINPDSLRAIQEEPTPRLFRSASDKGVRSNKTLCEAEDGLPNLIRQAPPALSATLSSYPLVLGNILEEEEEEESGDLDSGTQERQGECQKGADVPPIKGLGALRDLEGKNFIRSSFKVRVEPIEVTDNAGFINPAFDQDFDQISESVPEPKEKRFVRMPSVKRKKSTKRQQMVEDESAFDLAVRRRGERRDESLHVALLERFLVQSVVNKCIAE